MIEKIQFAVLIDADNVSAKYTKVIFDELEKYGFASSRRIYGNWSKNNGWNEETLLEYSILPIQQFSYTTGKNATDMAMAIDAMDLLYKDKVNGFCLVTSDSDFTRLAMRLREEQKYVLGMGESKTPVALTRACNKFIHLNLIDESNKETLTEHVATREEDVLDNVTSIEHVKNAISAIFNESGSSRLDLGVVGNRIGEKFTDFDVRNYGYSKLSVFLSVEMPNFTVVRENNHHYLKKDVLSNRSQVEEEIVKMIMESNGIIDNLSMINEELKRRCDNFDISDYGFSRISSFLRSIDGLAVSENTVKLQAKTYQK